MPETLSEAASKTMNLSSGSRIAAAFSRRPAILSYCAGATLFIGSWLLVTAMASNLPPDQFGPGGNVIAHLPNMDIPQVLATFLELCLRPTISVDGFETVRFFALTAMWFAMSMAMMLPSASPMITTYFEIADTARRRHMQVRHPLWLVAGYVSVWTFTSVVFASLAVFGAQFSGTSNLIGPADGVFAAGALTIAGLYQFTRLKHACLTRCRNPFATLFANWSSRRRGVFILGVRQGLWCVGCCWALMLIMLAVGTMNIFWMALLTLFALVEKTVGGKTLSFASGAITLVWAFAVLLIS